MSKPKLQDFYIHYRHKDSKIWQGLMKFRTRYVLEAIQMRREVFIENWNFAFPHKPDGEREVKNYVFEEFIA